MTCTSFSHARRVSSPCVCSSANWAASLASAGRGGGGGASERDAPRARQAGRCKPMGDSLHASRPCHWCQQQNAAGPPGRCPICRPAMAPHSCGGVLLVPTVNAAGAQAIADAQADVVRPAQHGMQGQRARCVAKTLERASQCRDSSSSLGPYLKAQEKAASGVAVRCSSARAQVRHRSLLPALFVP